MCCNTMSHACGDDKMCALTCCPCNLDLYGGGGWRHKRREESGIEEKTGQALAFLLYSGHEDKAQDSGVGVGTGGSRRG